MKRVFTLFLIILFYNSCTNKSNHEFYSYKSQDREILLLDINKKDNRYTLNLMFEHSNENVNSFGLIKFTGRFPKSPNQNNIRLDDSILLNDIKFSDGSRKKAPIDQSANIYLNLNNHQLNFLGKNLIVQDESYNKKYIKLIELHSDWNGKKIVFP